MPNFPANELIHETSPYLLQHAHNPVQWYAWGPSALSQAEQNNKPILLSIGYSACHWCHVMAHESFEDPITADLMNKLFINIKVDREERPDLDKIYQNAHMLLTQRPGGWPLTVFLMPNDRVPFFAGTYFPRDQVYGMPSFKDILQQISDYYHAKPEDLDKQNQALLQALTKLQLGGSGVRDGLQREPLQQARKELEQSMDWQFGGFGEAPKFPHPANLEFLLRYWQRANRCDAKAMEMVQLSLTAMANGGINDQLGGGFCRYSVDKYWMIPHFEKMLYDNGPLLALYAQAWLATGEDLYKEVSESTAAWVMREMQSPEGGFYSSLDADSEGHEGTFYVWSMDEVRQLLDKKQFMVFARRYGLDRDANFEGRWYPHVFTDWDELKRAFGQDKTILQHIINESKEILFNAREQRIRPGRDEKILTSWNGLMIKGMALASRVFKHQEWADSAQRALDFIKTTLWQDDRLLATYKDGRAHLKAYLDDYVFLMDGILALLQLRWRAEDLNFLVKLADSVLQHFEDTVHGGFYFTADDHENLIQRPKSISDESLASGNGVAAYVFSRLGHLLGEQRYLQAAEKTLKACWQSMEKIPYAHCSLLLALEEYFHPPQIIVLRGTDEEMAKWMTHCYNEYSPKRLAVAIPANINDVDLPGLLAQRPGTDAPVSAYICQGARCLPVTSNFEEFKKILIQE